MNRLLLTTLVSAGLAVVTAPVLAQGTPAPAGKGPQAAQPAQRDARTPSERIEARIAQLKSALKITDAQTPQWNAFADTLRKHASARGEQMKARHAQAEKGAKPAMTAIQRLEQRQAFLTAESARAGELLKSARPLYAALSPEQQKLADDMLARRGERGERGHRRPGGDRPQRG